MNKFSTPGEQRAELLALFREGVIDKETLRYSLIAIASESLETTQATEHKLVHEPVHEPEHQILDEILNEMPETANLLDEILNEMPDVKLINEIKNFEQQQDKKFYSKE